MIANIEIETKIRAHIVSEALQGDATGFSDDTDLIEIAAIDSMSIVDLVSFLEKEFGIEVHPGEVHPGNMKSVNTLAAMVRRLQRGERV